MNDLKLSNPKDIIGSGKLPLELVPATAPAWLAVAFLEGALKYGRFNWRIAGVRSSIYIAACLRHVWKWWNGEDKDPKTRVHHLASAMACLAIVLDAELCGKLKDDRPPMAPFAPFVDELADLVTHLKELFSDHSPHQYTIADSEPVQRSFEYLWRDGEEVPPAEEEADGEWDTGLMEYPETLYGTVPEGTELVPGGLVAVMDPSYPEPKPSLLRRVWDWLTSYQADPFQGVTFSCSSPHECDQCEDDPERCVCEEDEAELSELAPTYSAEPVPGVILGPFTTKEALDAAVWRFFEAKRALENPNYVYTAGRDAGVG